jgi:hypothetical protein
MKWILEKSVENTSEEKDSAMCLFNPKKSKLLLFLKRLFKRKELTAKELEKAMAEYRAEQFLAEQKEKYIQLTRYPWG